MRLLEKAISGYAAIGVDLELAACLLLTDLRHYCDHRDVDLEEALEDSLEVYLEERESEG